MVAEVSLAFRWMPLDLTDKSTLVQVMAWCREALGLGLGPLLSSEQWRHIRVSSQITDNSTVSSTACSDKQQSKYQSYALLTLKGNRGFPSQKDSNAECVSMSWRHHMIFLNGSSSPAASGLSPGGDYWDYHPGTLSPSPCQKKRTGTRSLNELQWLDNDNISGYVIFKWVAVKWLKHRAPRQ